MAEPSSPPAGSEHPESTSNESQADEPKADEPQAEVSAADVFATGEASPDLTEEELAIVALRMKAEGKPTPVKGGVAGAILAAALKGVGIALEPENHETVGIEQAGDKLDKDDDPLANVSFGELPPLS